VLIEAQSLIAIFPLYFHFNIPLIEAEYPLAKIILVAPQPHFIKVE
jgi:hypothetical protein